MAKAALRLATFTEERARVREESALVHERKTEAAWVLNMAAKGGRGRSGEDGGQVTEVSQTLAEAPALTRGNFGGSVTWRCAGSALAVNPRVASRELRVSLSPSGPESTTSASMGPLSSSATTRTHGAPNYALAL